MTTYFSIETYDGQKCVQSVTHEPFLFLEEIKGELVNFRGKGESKTLKLRYTHTCICVCMDEQIYRYYTTNRKVTFGRYDCL